MKKIIIVFAILLVFGGISWLVISQLSKKEILEVVPETVEELAVINGRGISQKLLLNYFSNTEEIMELYKDFNLYNSDSLMKEKGKFEDLGIDWLGGVTAFKYPFENRKVVAFAMLVNDPKTLEKWLLNNEFQKAELMFEMKQFKIFKADKFCIVLGDHEVYLLSFEKSLFMDFGRNIVQMEEADLSKVLAPIVKNKLNAKSSFFIKNQSYIEQQPWDLFIANLQEENKTLFYLTLDNGNVNAEIYLPNEEKDLELYDLSLKESILNHFWSWKPKDVADGLVTLLAFQNSSLTDEELKMVEKGLTGKGQFQWLDIVEDTVITKSMEMNPETYEVNEVLIKDVELKPIFVANIECVDKDYAFGVKELIDKELGEDFKGAYDVKIIDNQLYLYNDTSLNVHPTELSKGVYFHKGMLDIKHPNFTKEWKEFKMNRIESEGDVKNDMIHMKVTAYYDNTDINALFLMVHDALLIRNLN